MDVFWLQDSVIDWLSWQVSPRYGRWHEQLKKVHRSLHFPWFWQGLGRQWSSRGQPTSTPTPGRKRILEDGEEPVVLGTTQLPLTTTFSMQPTKKGSPWAKMRKKEVAPPRTVIPKLVSVELMDSTGLMGYMASSLLTTSRRCVKLKRTRTDCHSASLRLDPRKTPSHLFSRLECRFSWPASSSSL